MHAHDTNVPLFRKAQSVHPKEYRSWKLMRSRCRNPKNPCYAYYGGRGVAVCERWDSFALFLADMGKSPTPKHTLDRFPNPDGNYEPGNVRWATRQQQSRNISTNCRVTHDGKTLCLSEWAEATNLSATLISKRLCRGWSVHDALTIPSAGKRRKRGQPFLRDSYGKFSGNAALTIPRDGAKIDALSWEPANASGDGKGVHKPLGGGSNPPPATEPKP